VQSKRVSTTGSIERCDNPAQVLRFRGGCATANIIKLVSIIARELETLTAPQFDSISLVAR
jgi:hypothetical protein